MKYQINLSKHFRRKTLCNTILTLYQNMIREVFRAMLNIYEGGICGDSFSIVDLSQGPKYTSDNNKVLPFYTFFEMNF